MKILINPEETYEIKIPNEINANDFIKLLTSFDNVVKLIRFNVIKNEILEPDTRSYIKKTKGFRKGSRTYCDTREKTLDLLQYAYHGTKKDKERIVKLAGTNWNNISKSFWGLRKRYNIKSDEIGLFPNMNANSHNSKIPNYTIKSYTGYFDEN